MCDTTFSNIARNPMKALLSNVSNRTISSASNCRQCRCRCSTLFLWHVPIDIYNCLNTRVDICSSSIEILKFMSNRPTPKSSGAYLKDVVFHTKWHGQIIISKRKFHQNPNFKCILLLIYLDGCTNMCLLQTPASPIRSFDTVVPNVLTVNRIQFSSCNLLLHTYSTLRHKTCMRV